MCGEVAGIVAIENCATAQLIRLGSKEKEVEGVNNELYNNTNLVG